LLFLGAEMEAKEFFITN